MGAITLFCEGVQNSLDFRMLNLLLSSSAIGNVVLIPAGSSKTGLKAFIKGYKAQPRVISGDAYMIYRDRDYDFVIPESPCLTKDPSDTRILVSYRTTVENYLLTPENLFDFYDSRRMQKKVGSLSAARALFEEATGNLSQYTAARWAFSTVRREYPEFFKSGMRWPFENGVLPDNLDKSACKITLLQLVEDSKNASARISTDIFEDRYEFFSNKFDDSFTRDAEKCLIWFNGKDIARMIHHILGGNSVFHPGKGSFYDHVFTKKLFRANDFPDLIELKKILTNNHP